MTGDEDDGNVNARVRQLALKVQTVHSRKSDVQDEATWPVRAVAAQERFRCSESLGTQANRLQHDLDGGTYQVIGIDDEDYGGGGLGLHSPAAASMGRVR